MALIQIIDDDVILLASLGFLLEEAGYRVQKSSDLTHAEQAYQEEPPDLLIIEVRSERERGWDLLARIAPRTPVMVVSAAAREEDMVRGFAAGAIDYIAKPYRSSELLARVRSRLPVVQTTAPAEGYTAIPERLGPHLPPPPRPAKRRASDDDAVFMSEAEEMALLRIPPPSQLHVAPAEPAPFEHSDRIGPRLRQARMRRHLTLVQVENELKVRISYLQAIEDEKFTLLPRGAAALDMFSRYVTFLGLEAEPLIAEFRAQHYVEENAPMPALGGPRMPRSMPRWPIWMMAVLLALVVAVGTIFYFDPAFFQQIQQLLPAAA
ncbi:response regulator receiver protein [Oscillochloris trichoides DG-6]|uniref:Response regulator receiver protein n=1 Tax=Oscillochloris trichoides DG-6 TaxID=765420 RepID=E1IEP0_9CHLR|nr:response regulator [Oscillochloris trichoides]EFO80332.1 response regulator receiver protein [Oscillochloris trichoides DG-6]